MSFGPLMTRGCPMTYASGRSTPSPGSDRTNKFESHEKGEAPETESYVCSMEEIRTDVVSDKYTDEDNSDSFSELQGSILWPRRSYMYRVAFLSMLPAFGLFLFGFSCPFWMKKYQVAKQRGHYNQIDRVDVSIGLWRVCQGLDFIDLTDCTTIPDISSYTMACQSMLCLCLIFSFFSLVFGLYENCATRYEIDEGGDGRTRRPEVNAVVAGIFGMVGVSLYGVIIIGVARDGNGGVHWAFPLTACAVTGLTICGILMAISNRIRSSPMSYGGQVIGLSCQSSPHSREISMQDRLVSPNSMATPSTTTINNGNGSATYSGAAMEMLPNPTQMNVIQRTESCLSSHMSSPDLFKSSADLDASSSPNMQMHVVETHDLYSRPTDPVKKQILKRHHELKAAQRRSWHVDDKHFTGDVLNNPPGATPSVDTTKRKEVIKPPVPPRRDKMPPPQKPLQTITDADNDLMVLDDPVVTLPCSSRNETDTTESININTNTNTTDSNTRKKRNTNPFLEDMDIYSGSADNVDRNDVDGADQWQNQPWPEPPSESEISRDHPVENNSCHNNSILHKRSLPNSNDVPEILQYTPQNSGSLSRTHSTGSRPDKAPKPTDPVILDSGVKGTTSGRRPGSRRGNRDPESQHGKNKSDTQKVPVMKEYDNPVFKRQPSPLTEPRGHTTMCQPIYDSTSFITPAPLTAPPPPPTYAAAMATDSSSFHPKQSHNNHGKSTPTNNDSASKIINPGRLAGHYDSLNIHQHQHQNRKQGLQHTKSLNSPQKCSPKTKPKPKPPEKSRPRQVKREHNQRRAAPNESPIPSSPPPGYYSSNPDISRQSPGASPRVARRRPESMGREIIRTSDNTNNSTNLYQHQQQQQDMYKSSSARQSPYLASHPPWDSDL